MSRVHIDSSDAEPRFHLRAGLPAVSSAWPTQLTASRASG